MRKLFSLKKWLNIDEAATMISEEINEPVGSADVLQLALDGHLVLSINMVNGAYGRAYVPVNLEEIEIENVPGLDGKSVVALPVRGKLFVKDSVVYQVKESITELSCSVWDLPMIGGERIHVEHKFQVMNHGPLPTTISLGNVLVRGADGQLFELQEYEKDSAHDPLRDSFFNPKNFHPAGCLPEDSEFVVRPENIKQFINNLADPSKAETNPLTPREKTTLFNIIGVLLELMQKSGTRRESAAKIIEEILATYPKKQGISKTNLEKKFAEARRILQSD